MIDACVDIDGNLVEIFEVKPSLSRSELYKAIGQLMVYGTPHGDSKLFLVLPEGQIAKDIMDAIEKLDIKIIRYRSSGNTFSFKPKFD